MKLLILLLVVLGGVWLYQRGRARALRGNDAARNPPKALPMVRCARCGTHVPRDDAVLGQRGSYCTNAHRRESEGA